MPWCDECACITNHTGEQHREAEWEQDPERATDDRWDVRHDAYKDGSDL